MESQHLNHSDLLKTLLTNNLYEKAIQQANRKYKIKHYRIEKLKPSGIKNLLKKNIKKQKVATVEENNYAWAEGQLKIFVWFLVGYVHIKKIDICDMNESDFHFFNEIFQGYSIQFLHYQAKFLLRSTEKVAWTQIEAKLLNSIIKAKFQQKNWNTVAYELYLMSDKTVFRTPKQCRERWLNHQDPNKIHTQWTVQEDIELLRFVKSLGKKWSHISRSMKSTRTEHMVKNRFTSLMKKAIKNQKNPTQKELIEQLLKAKKNQKSEKDNDLSPLTQLQNSEIMTVSNDSTNEVQMNIELQEIEMTQDYLTKKEKELDFLIPCNLIAEQASQIDQQPLLRENYEIINVFQVDNQNQREMFLSWFD